jgi:pimeloyl-ACP methyl ester carboxylesterase
MRAIVKFCAIVGVLMGLTACASRQEFDSGESIRSLSAGVQALSGPIEIHAVTTRCDNDPKPSLKEGTEEHYLQERCWNPVRKNAELVELGFGMADGGQAKCAIAAVTVPPKGSDAPPARIGHQPYDCGSDFERLRSAMLATKCKCALVFVHGFNTTYAFALRRTGQIAQDFGKGGLVIVFSPGAAGRIVDYANDVEAAELAAPSLNRMLNALYAPDATGASNIDVIAHSMGARLTLRAMSEGPAPKLRRVIVPAADIEPAYFLRQAAKTSGTYEKMTVYTSKYDLALSASDVAHGGWARLGAGVSPGLGRELSKVVVVNATAGADDYYGHSYFAESERVMSDVRGALDGIDPFQRAPLVCERASKTSATHCKIPCPEGETCRPSWFQQAVTWILD